MSRWLVEGAGSTGANGTYVWDNVDRYRKLGEDPNEHALLSVPGGWLLITHHPPVPLYKGTGESLPANPWSVEDGEAPAPTLSAVPLPSISGRVMAGGVGQDGTQINLTGDATDSTQTADGGYYEFTDVENGDYTVMPLRTGYTYDPTYRDITVEWIDVTGVDFAAVGRPQAAAGTVLKLDGEVVAAVRRITPAQGGEALDVSQHDSPQTYREFLAGLRGGEITVEALYTPEGFALLHAQLMGRDPGTWRVEYPGEDWWQAEGHCLALSPQAPVEGAVVYAATIRLSGKPVCSWEAS